MSEELLKSFQEAYRNLELLPLVEPKDLSRFRVDYGGEIIEELEQLVEDSPSADGKIIFTGHRGCGKSTLLAEFSRRLRVKRSSAVGNRYFVVSFSIADTIEMSDVNHINILFAIALNLMSEAEASRVEIPQSTKEPLYKWFAKRTRTEETKFQGEASTGFDFFKLIITKLKVDYTIRYEIKQEFERKLSDLVARINEIAALIQVASKKEILVIIDDLDKLDLARVNEIYQDNIKALVEQLYFLRLGEERSEQEIFFGYLQWTREALREFPYAIVLWVTHQILVNLSQKAPDFWSWRNGVFRFVSKKTNAVPGREIEPIRFAFSDELASTDDDNPYFLPIQDLQKLIEKIEQERGVKDASLATLYSRLGDIYKRRLERGEAQDYKKEEDLAIKYFRKAVELQKELGLETDLATSLNNLAYLYNSQGRYSEAEPLLVHALALYKRLVGEKHPDIAICLNNLASLYESTGRYSEAEALLVQALALYKRLVEEKHLLGEEYPDIATNLNNLANLYYYQGRYSEAEPLYLQALTLSKHLVGEEHSDIAISLNNLALLYESTGRYSEAEPLLLQALALSKRLLGEEHPDVATSLNNLASLYYAQGRYSEAEPLLLQALALSKRLLGEEHPDIAISLNNLALPYESTGRYSEAEHLYQRALEIRERVLGTNHPNTVTVRKNLERLRVAMHSGD